MAQNITLLGASYTDVPAVILPKTGGGTARFDDASVTTASASDVASGKIFLASDGTITTGTNSGGGGGASNFVTGTFTGTTTGAVIDVDIPYTGNGYPLVISVAPTGGVRGNTDFNSLIQRYVIGFLSAYKSYASTVPSYSFGDQNQYTVCTVYKSSTSSATAYSRTSSISSVITYGNSADPSGAVQSLLFRNSKKFSVLIASTAYGFAANIEYTYYIIYSS